jgi:cobalt-zinc-cadmium efflux system membrane fusion protein
MTHRWLTGGLGLAAGIVITIAAQSFLAPSPGGADDQAEADARGPHGGRLLEGEALTLEVTIFEEGVPPRYRIFPMMMGGAPLRPTEVQLTGVLERLGGATDQLTFTPEGDYLRSNEVVEEPHSFVATFTARANGRSHTLRYEQVEGRTEIAEAALASTGISVATAAGGDLTPTIDLPGEVVLPPDRHVMVSARAPGVLSEVRVSVGQIVERGDVLAVITSPQVATAAAAYVAARARLEFARTTRDREATLVERRITALQDLQLADQALAIATADANDAREALQGFGLEADAIAALASGTAAPSHLPVTAPARGVITEQNAARGESVAGGAPLLIITDATDVWVNVQVHARDLGDVVRGRRVVVRGIGTNHEATGTITSVSPLVGEDTRTATARVALSNRDGRWHPGLFVTVRVALAPTPAEVVVPVDAVQTFRDWSVVFVRYGDVFEARPVETGRTDGRVVEIVTGLRPGERYAATNAYAVKADVLKSGASHDH